MLLSSSPTLAQPHPPSTCIIIISLKLKTAAFQPLLPLGSYRKFTKALVDHMAKKYAHNGKTCLSYCQERILSSVL